MKIPVLCLIFVKFCIYYAESIPVYRELAPSQLAPSLRFYYPFVTLGDTDIDIENLSRVADVSNTQPQISSQVMSYAPGYPENFLRSLRSPTPTNMENFYQATKHWHIGDLVGDLMEPSFDQVRSRFSRDTRGKAEKRQRYHANFDILAGGGLGR